MKTYKNLLWGLLTALLLSLVTPIGAYADVYLRTTSVSLSWPANTESDIQGYEVFRSNSYSGGFSKLNSGFIAGTSWVDTTVSNGNAYYYELRAADLCGNISTYSAPSDAVIIDLTSPTVSANPPAGTYSRNISVTLVPSETAIIHYTTNGTIPTLNSQVYANPIPVTTNLTLKYLAVDRAGNQSSVARSQYVIVDPDIDSDNDGYLNGLEQQMGSDPYDAASQPTASSLAISSSQEMVKVGGTARLNVVGTFVPTSGPSLQYDMTCLVQYQTNPLNITTVDACGNAVGQSQGTSTVWANQIVNGRTVATSNIAMVTVDGTPPLIDTLETHPYDGQGMNEDTNGNGTLDPGEDLDGDRKLDVDTGPTSRVPSDTGVVVRVVDNLGIDTESITMLVNGTAVPVKVRQFTQDNSHEADIAYRNTGNFQYGQVVTVELSLADIAGNTTNFKESFQIESQTEHQWALNHMPVQTTTAMGDGTSELAANPVPDSINDDLLDGAKIVFNSSEPVKPRFGPVDELPPLDIATPVGIPVNLEPANLFNSPVTLFLPLPGAQLTDTNHDGIPDSGLGAYDIYEYTAEPAVLWRNIMDVPGWAVENSRVNHYETVPPSIEIEVNHFSGVQVGYDCVAPHVNFSASATRVEMGGAVQFQDNSVGTITSWLWNFGDGSTSTSQNPTHTYSVPGTYTVTLTVTGQCGSNSMQRSRYIVVTDRTRLIGRENGSKLRRKAN